MITSVPEGTWFMLPVEKGQYGFGLVVRAPRRGGVLLGYFFGPKRSVRPAPEWLEARSPMQAVLVARFRDRALLRDEWPTVHLTVPFDRHRWPLPAFHRFDGSMTATLGATRVCDWRVEYSDENLVTPIAEQPATPSDMRLGDDTVYDPAALIRQVATVLMSTVPTADDSAWR
jgi:hypothetical protein